GEAAIHAHEGLRVALAAGGLTFDPATGDVVELRAAVPAMSKRSRQIAANLEQIEADWQAQHPGQVPGPRVVRGWHRLAWEMGRPDKKPGVAPDEDLWRAEIHATGYTHPTTPVPLAPRLGVGAIDRDQVAALAIEQAQARRSTWSTADLTEHTARLLAHAGVTAPRRVLMETIEDISTRAATLCESVAPAVWATGAVPDGYRHLTSRHVIRTEQRLGDLLQTLTDTTTPGIDADHVDYLLNRLDIGGFGREPLGEDQLAAVTAMSSGAGLVVVTGAAGAGKTRMLTAAAAVTRALGCRQVVVAPSMKAALGAAQQAGAAASSVHKLLHAYGWRWNEDGTRWWRLQPGRVDPATGRPVPSVPAELRLGGRTQLVIDEAGMLEQEAALRLLDLARDAGAQVVMIGDTAQLGAVGRGGVLDLATR
ncbi:AAA family ATPase, partial [Miniimonas arenae]|uniref:AAA family ATPase n=2 Tax=Miniimonas TaxID=947525 RepID=UPI0028B1B1E1